MRLVVILGDEEAEGLVYMAREELRDLGQQLRYLLRAELIRRGLLPDEGATPGDRAQEVNDG
jgi:hypothetical protein